MTPPHPGLRSIRCPAASLGLTGVSAQCLAKLAHRFIHTGHVPAPRRCELRCAASPAADGGRGHHRQRPRVYPGILPRRHDDRDSLGTVDTNETDDSHHRMVPNGYGQVAQLARLEPVASFDYAPRRARLWSFGAGRELVGLVAQLL